MPDGYGPFVGGIGPGQAATLPSAAPPQLGAGPNLGIFAAKPPSVAGPGTLPTLGAGPTGGLDMGGIQDLMNSLLPQSSRVTPEEFKAAMTPIAQKGPVSVPGAFGYRTPNPPPAMLDKSPVIGAGNARAQGIGNAVSATVGALAQFKATRDQRRQEADATKVSRLVEAQNAVGQAQQVLAADPNNQAAKKAIEDNNNIIQGMFQDPKFVKTVEKGFQISLTDPSQNKTPDHNIVQRGLDMFKQRSGQQMTPQQMQQMGQQAAQRFTAAQPTQMAQNTQAQQQVQMKMAQQKATEDYVKAFMPMMVQQTKYQQAQTLQQAKQSFDASMEMYRAGQARYIQAEKYNQASTLAQYNAEKAFALEGMREAGRLTYLAKAVASKYDNPLAQQQLIDTANNQWNTQVESLRSHINTLQDQYDGIIKASTYPADPKSDPTNPRVKQAQSLLEQIESMKTNFATLDQQHDRAMDSIGSIIRGGKPNAGQSPTGVPQGAAGPGPSGVPSPAGGVAGVADAAIAAEGAAEPPDITFDPTATNFSQYLQ